MSGTGVLPEIAVSPAAHDYGGVLVGTVASRSFVVRNEGNGTLALTVQELIGIDASSFAIALGAGTFNIAPGDSHRVDIAFTPQSLAAHAAALRLMSDDSDESTLELALTGNGIAPEIAVHPLDYDFGAVLLSDSTSHAFVVRNLGTAVLGVSSTTLSGTDAGDFAITSGTGAFSVAPGDSHQIVVRFAPLMLGTKSAALQIT